MIKFLREGTYDAEIVKEIRPSYGWLDVKGKTVLDIGACFGAATVYFVEQGAARVIAVEPVPDNVAQLRKNTKGMPVDVLSAAVGPEAGKAELFLSQGINTGSHSQHVTRGRTSISVPMRRFRTLLSTYRPSVLKIDCEGAEYDFLTEPLPSYVKQVAMEIHLNKKHWRYEEFPKLLALFEEWEIVKQPRLTVNNWHTLGGWKR